MSTDAARIAAPVMEVFPSFQGEGLYVGQPQVFLRLAGCPLRCSWCDTPASWKVRAHKSAEIRRDGEPVAHEKRWASPFQAALWIASVEPGEPRPVSVTGGEPLIWPAFIRALAPMLGARRIHLETAGAHPEALARVMDRVDHVSLDLKLPDDLFDPVELVDQEGAEVDLEVQPTTERAPKSDEEWRIARRRSLDLVRETDACAKIVVQNGRPSRAYDELFEDVARRAPELPVFLAPATPIGSAETPTYEHLVDVAEHARDLDLDVRVLPQVHRSLGIA